MLPSGDAKAPGERFQTARLAVSEEKLREKVEALLDNLESGPARGEGYDRVAAGELYDILLKPVEKSLEGRALIVVPDGILARLPFEALVVAKDGGRTYLLEEYPVKYVQSASVLATLRTSSRPAAATGGFVGFGDPVYDYDRFRKGEREDVPPGDGGAALRRYAGMAGRLSRLEASGDEVRGIDLLFREGNREGKTLLRAEARESYAKGQAMEHYGYIHFSMHGILAPGYQAIARAIAARHRVEVIPGAGAVETALVASGLPASSYTFLGFPPRKPGPRRRLLCLPRQRHRYSRHHRRRPNRRRWQPFGLHCNCMASHM